MDSQAPLGNHLLPPLETLLLHYELAKCVPSGAAAKMSDATHPCIIQQFIKNFTGATRRSQNLGIDFYTTFGCSIWTEKIIWKTYLFVSLLVLAADTATAAVNAVSFILFVITQNQFYSVSFGILPT